MAILRLILIAVLIYLGVKILMWVGRAWRSLNRRPESLTGSRATEVNEMIRDPVCGVYVLSHDAVAANVNGNHILFCSSACRDKYLSSRAGDRHGYPRRERSGTDS